MAAPWILLRHRREPLLLLHLQAAWVFVARLGLQDDLLLQKVNQLGQGWHGTGSLHQRAPLQLLQVL